MRLVSDLSTIKTKSLPASTASSGFRLQPATSPPPLHFTMHQHQLPLSLFWVAEHLTGATLSECE